MGQTSEGPFPHRLPRILCWNKGSNRSTTTSATPAVTFASSWPEAAPQTVEAFLGCASSPAYRRRLIKTLRKFYAFANERLGLAARTR